MFDIRFVVFVDGQCHEFQIGAFYLREEMHGLIEAKIAPGFAQNGFHVFNQQIEFLNIPTDRARNKRRGLRGAWKDTRHLPRFL
ncbi:hypothetical protein GCM10011363_25880 [Marivita lacus]|uniref:Uncharacterized protein n=1 Tax=Marivita lacus TaxID=1323742 RepID=A0ABQ1KUU2_9RHOB|nr:hypothetical protein GCM10011363_25880 [Marivita lacus]